MNGEKIAFDCAPSSPCIPRSHSERFANIINKKKVYHQKLADIDNLVVERRVMISPMEIHNIQEY